MSRYERLSEELSRVSALCLEFRRLLDEPGRCDGGVKQGIIERIESIENSMLESLKIIKAEEEARREQEEEHKSPAEPRVDVVPEPVVDTADELLVRVVDETISEMFAAHPGIEAELLSPGGGSLGAYIDGVKDRIREMGLGTRTVVDLPKYIWWNQELEVMKRLSRKLKEKYRLSKRDHNYHLVFTVVKEYYGERISFYKQVAWDTFVGKDRDRLAPN